jgi:allantoin racemase
MKMKIRIVIPIALNVFNQIALDEALQTKAPDTTIDVVNLDSGPENIESFYEEALAAPHIVEKVIQAEKDGCEGVFVSCFGDPAVDASRDKVKIPVVGAFQPAVFTASLISIRWSIVTVSRNAIPYLWSIARKVGVESKVASIRRIDTSLLDLLDEKLLIERLVIESEKTIDEDGAEAIILGCTGMGRVAQAIAQQLAGKGKRAPVLNPTASAIGHLEYLIRSGISQSPLTYLGPPPIK